MTTIKKNEVRYIAPEMKTTMFRMERGYATSVASTSVKISMSGSSL